MRSGSREIDDFLADQSDLMVDLVTAWAQVNSHSRNLEGLKEMLDALRHAFSALHGAEEVLELPDIDVMDMSGQVAPVKVGRALRISKRPDAPVRVLLGGHMDTVFPVTSPFQAVSRPSKDRLVGPGVADMKGGLVVMLKALEAFEQTKDRERLGWELLITADEELGSPASQALWSEAKGFDAALLFEPSLPGGSLVSKRAASATFTLVMLGKAAHAGRNPQQGRSAITALAELIHLLESHNEEQSSAYINVGKIEGGVSANVVAACASCQMNIRADDDDSLAAILGFAADACKSVEKKTGVQCRWHQDSRRPHKPFDARSKRLFALLSACAKLRGSELSWQESRGVCDGNLLAAAGIPTVDTLGVQGDALHSEEEYLLIESLVQRAGLAAQVLTHISQEGAI